jgi:hypothetical protein
MYIRMHQAISIFIYKVRHFQNTKSKWLKFETNTANDMLIVSCLRHKICKLIQNIIWYFCIFTNVFIVVLPCILISSKFLCQQMHSLLKHKMLQLTLKISLYMPPTCFGPLGPSSGSIRRNFAEVSLCRIISKNTSLKLLLCSGNMCFSL